MFLQINTATNETPHRAPRRTRNTLRMRTKLLRSTEKPATARVRTLENLNHWAESRVKWSILRTNGKSWKYLSFKAASDSALVKRWQWPYLWWSRLGMPWRRMRHESTPAWSCAGDVLLGGSKKGRHHSATMVGWDEISLSSTRKCLCLGWYHRQILPNRSNWICR